MQLNLDSDWKQLLSSEFEKDYFIQLTEKVELAYENEVCFPSKELIFNAFNLSNFKDLKVVIIGQDPYHGEGEANGLAFSVNDSVKIPPSLQNIFKEVNVEFDNLFMPSSGNLERWAKQGVLLLNSTLTVEKDKPNSHKDFGWQAFTDAVIELISSKNDTIVFMLWGNFAQKKSKLIDSDKHLVLQCGHPSFAGVHKKWFGNNHFVLANNFLEKIGKKAIDWI